MTEPLSCATGASRAIPARAPARPRDALRRPAPASDVDADNARSLARRLGATPDGRAPAPGEGARVRRRRAPA